MIGLDTNVLLRIFVTDDAAQTELVRTALAKRSEDDPAFVSVVAIVEMVWALKGIYDFDRTKTGQAVASLLDSSNVVVENEAVIKRAIDLSRDRNADVADCVVALLGAEAGCTATLTFDRKAAMRIPGMELLA